MKETNLQKEEKKLNKLFDELIIKIEKNRMRALAQLRITHIKSGIEKL